MPGRNRLPESKANRRRRLHRFQEMDDSNRRIWFGWPSTASDDQADYDTYDDTYDA